LAEGPVLRFVFLNDSLRSPEVSSLHVSPRQVDPAPKIEAPVIRRGRALSDFPSGLDRLLGLTGFEMEERAGQVHPGDLLRSRDETVEHLGSREQALAFGEAPLVETEPSFEVVDAGDDRGI